MFTKVACFVALVAAANAGLILSQGGLGGELGGLEGLGGYGGLDGGYGGLALGGKGIALAPIAVKQVAVAPVAVAPVALKQTVVDYHAPAQYEFKYGVEDLKTGDIKGQSEVRVGDTVKGEYSVAEPDGTLRIVKYTADSKNGFNAIVSRIGKAVHPQIIQKAIALPIAIQGGLDDGLGHGY